MEQNWDEINSQHYLKVKLIEDFIDGLDNENLIKNNEAIPNMVLLLKEDVLYICSDTINEKSF